MGYHPSSIAKTTDTSLKIVSALQDLDGASLDELSDYLDLAPSTVHRHITTLQHHDYVTSTDDGYQIGLQFLTVGGYAQRKSTAYPMIKEKVDDLAAKTGEQVNFVVEEHGERVCLYTESGENAVEIGTNIGRRGPLHTSAAGKAILANLPRSRVDDIISPSKSSEPGPNGIDEREELSDTLEQIRSRGYAFSYQEVTDGANAVGAVVMDKNDTVLGALSVSGPMHRLNGDRLTTQLPEQLLGAVNELELHVKHAVTP